MANRFWVGGTGTWDSTTTTHWATGTGGAGGASAPVAGDAVTFDGASGGGTVTPDATIDSIAFLSLSAGGFTGTLAFNTNNPNMVFTTGSVNFSGSGTRTINMGSGTWTLGGGFDCTTVTGLTATFSNATINLNASSAARTFVGGAQTYGAVSIGSNATKGYVRITGNNTFASLTVAEGNTVLGGQGSTNTISGALTMTGTASSPVGLQSDGPVTAVTTFSVGSASTIAYGGILRVTKSGAGSITATNSFDLGGNTSITITGPSVGGGGGQRVISG